MTQKLRFFSCATRLSRIALSIYGALLVIGCSGGGGDSTTSGGGVPSGSGGSSPSISIARITPNVQKFRIHGSDLIWSDGDPFVGLKKASIGGGSDIPLTIPMKEPLSLRVLGQDVYWIEDRFISNDAHRLIVKASPDGAVGFIGQGRSCVSSENEAFVLDNENAYWVVCEASSNNSFIQKVPLNGN